jgi:hypothetical protein
MKRFFKILWAEICVNLYCAYHALFHLKFYMEFNAYDKNNNLILIAATDNISIKTIIENSEQHIKKIFYSEEIIF